MLETKTHVYFWGGIYSQWAKSSLCEMYNKFNTAEQYMMYHKAVLFGDYEIAEQVLATNDARKQKALGREVKNFDEKVWDNYKYDIVVNGNMLKFFQNESMKLELLKTGDKTLVEGSPYDRIWGVGLKWDDPKILDEKNWKGENLLGKALMDVRKKIREIDEELEA